MVIWTIVPEKTLFPEKNGEDELTPEEINYAGCKILAQSINENQYQIVRIISTDPNDYLNNKLEPGKIINCRKTFEAFS